MPVPVIQIGKSRIQVFNIGCIKFTLIQKKRFVNPLNEKIKHLHLNSRLYYNMNKEMF